MTNKTKASPCTVAFYDPQQKVLLELEKVSFSFQESLFVAHSLVNRETPSRYWLAWTGSRVRVCFLDGFPRSFNIDSFVLPLRDLVPNFSSLEISCTAPALFDIEEI
ncbi:MAG: hypothetical protein ACH34X_08850 [Thiolinea sp.]